MSKWPTLKLGELMATDKGSVNPMLFQNETFELYSIPAFDIGVPEYKKGSDIGSTKQNVQPSDVLLSRIVPHIRRAWVVSEKKDNRQIASGEWIVFRSKQVIPDYLRYFLISDIFHTQFMSTVAGVGGSLLRARPSQVKEFTIPLPPLAEQKRIAAILDKADALRRKDEELLRKYDELAQAIFIDMFGDPQANDKYNKVKLGDIASFTGGGTPDRKNHAFYQGTNLWATSKDMKGVFLFDTEEKISDTAIENSATKKVPAGTLLVVVKSKILLRTLPVLITTTETCINQDIKAILTGGSINPFYLLSHMKIGQDTLLTVARGVNTEGLTLDHLRAYEVMLPPLHLQNQYSSAFQHIQNLKSKLNISNSESLFQSLLQNAFSGQL